MTFSEAIEGQPISWVKGFAKKVAPSSVDPEDLISEGMYAMWQAYERRSNDGSNLSSYLIQAAKWQILRVLERRKWTGQDKTRAPRGQNSTGVVHADEVEQYYPDDILRDWAPAAEDFNDTADLADVRAEVRKAVGMLPESQRDRIFRKYWLCEPVWLSGNWWRDPKWGARARLQADLQHLNTGEWEW